MQVSIFNADGTINVKQYVRELAECKADTGDGIDIALATYTNLTGGTDESFCESLCTACADIVWAVPDLLCGYNMLRRYVAEDVNPTGKWSIKVLGSAFESDSHLNAEGTVLWSTRIGCETFAEVELRSFAVNPNSHWPRLVLLNAYEEGVAATIAFLVNVGY